MAFGGIGWTTTTTVLPLQQSSRGHMRERCWQDAKPSGARQKRGPRGKTVSGSSCKSLCFHLLWTKIFDPNIPTFQGLQTRVEIQWFHPRLKHSLTPLISEDRSFFLGWGTWTATDTSCLVQTQPKGLSGHTHYQQHVTGFSVRKSNSLPHLLSLSFKDQSCAHSWSLCESCLIN